MAGRRKVAYRKRRQNRLSIILVTMVVIMIIIVVGIGSIGLLQKRNEQQATIENLENQISAEEERTKDIEEYASYTQTKQFIIDLAHDKLGLVYDGETVFKEDND
ncbi:MAG: septum formation initiator family protein [Lachnospiraceae bacterium]|jgi:cell division protein FtsB|nr:septum formation initiator family protein [Lachnospiraceae bacterium]MBR4994133.1 septum formation initiator family protein [Lachnospiraceae bacterium]MBR5945221.1 septum formation initiator family protein [Lachnospiraceae bacterium]